RRPWDRQCGARTSRGDALPSRRQSDDEARRTRRPRAGRSRDLVERAGVNSAPFGVRTPNTSIPARQTVCNPLKHGDGLDTPIARKPAENRQRHTTENRSVGGSIPPLGTIEIKSLAES